MSAEVSKLYVAFNDDGGIFLIGRDRVEVARSVGRWFGPAADKHPVVEYVPASSLAASQKRVGELEAIVDTLPKDKHGQPIPQRCRVREPSIRREWDIIGVLADERADALRFGTLYFAGGGFARVDLNDIEVVDAALAAKEAAHA